MRKLCFQFLSLILTSSIIAGVYSSTNFTLVNECEFTVWPVILSNAGVAPLSTTGFTLQIGESKVIEAPSSWGGRFWGRTDCTQDIAGNFSCITGDCGSGTIECAGVGAVAPATLAEFTLNCNAGQDLYDVSLVDGYNLPMLVVPQGGSGVNCIETGCVADLNGACPSELRVTSAAGEGVACKSACEAFQMEQYCCSGAYGTPDACKATQYSQMFKSACPQAYSYAYDDRTSTFNCTGADYIITFCPSPDTSKHPKSRSGGRQNPRSEDNSNTPIDGKRCMKGGLKVGAEVSVSVRVLGGAIAVSIVIGVAILAIVLYITSRGTCLHRHSHGPDNESNGSPEQPNGESNGSPGQPTGESNCSTKNDVCCDHKKWYTTTNDGCCDYTKWYTTTYDGCCDYTK